MGHVMDEYVGQQNWLTQVKVSSKKINITIWAQIKRVGNSEKKQDFEKFQLTQPLCFQRAVKFMTSTWSLS